MKHFKLSTDYPKHLYSCAFSLAELLREDLEPAERHLLNAMEVNQTPITYTFTSGLGAQYTRIR